MSQASMTRTKKIYDLCQLKHTKNGHNAVNTAAFTTSGTTTNSITTTIIIPPPSPPLPSTPTSTP
eukprot:5394443-Pleurochrysis_carterae.AAC.3